MDQSEGKKLFEMIFLKDEIELLNHQDPFIRESALKLMKSKIKIITSNKSFLTF